MTAIFSLAQADVSIGVSDGLAYPLTPCCEASGKGSSNVESGVVCRACYHEVDPKFGGCAPLYAVPGAWPLDRQVRSWVGPNVSDEALATLVAQIERLAP